jgi:hypothetical protein
VVVHGDDRICSTLVCPILPPGIDWVRPAGLWVELFKAVFTQEVPSDTRLLVIIFLGSRIFPFALLFAIASFPVGWLLQGLVVAVRQLIKNRHDHAV